MTKGRAEWWRGAVIYQIYPRSFCDSNSDGVGDLPGIISKLDYVAGLGVDGVWLSPFFVSPMKDFGYDVADYRDVDPLFGTLADFDALLARAHALGLKVIIDQVWAHTSDAHPWFVASAAARQGPKADWYVWADARPDGSPPNNWQASFGGPSWTWGPRRRQYYFHNFLAAQPDLNFWNPAVGEEILSIARFWLDRGVDGFRLDVIANLFKDRKLRENPRAAYETAPAMPTSFQRHVFDRCRPETVAFLSRLRALTDTYEDRMMVGEVVDTPPLPRQLEYTAGTDRLHTAYGFLFLSARSAPPALFAEAMTAWEGASGWPSWSLGNHDVPRFASRLARSGDPRQARALLAALFFLRGTIFLYQGEELGLPQANLPLAALKDPYAIAAYTGGAGRDGARTPMPWTTEGPSAGFSASAETWLPVDPAHRPLAVAAQQAGPDSFLQFTRRLIALRAAHPALRLGEARVLRAPDGVLAIERSWQGERLLCLINLGDQPAEFESGGQAAGVEDFLGGSVERGRARLASFAGAVASL
ncbi:MAG TPA: alpha-amylase family glycosyl hydrolase [Caulobacteraceae bacterium]|nr:alpha-amylase family glycosyl hydrolase [Caulobacteraceae bacterium]